MSGSTPSLNLVATKLIVPPTRAHLVERPRLFSRIEAGLQGKLTLIAAPAGSGKTTLLSAWCTTAAAKGLRLAWVALDSGDNDPLLFWTYALSALDGVMPGVATVALTLLHSPQPAPIDYVLTSLLNAFSEPLADNPSPQVALVLEDYHVITAPDIHKALAWLLDRLPATLHLVLLTRADPALPLARMRVSGDLTELHADDLRFAPDEVDVFLNQVMGLALAPDDLGALGARTEGWIAGLQLAALALRNHRDTTRFIQTFTGNNRYIVDYLAAEVIEHQPPQLQTFLLQTSILDRLCGPLCDAVLGLSGSDDGRVTSDLSSQSLLETLVRANLFVVPLDEDRYWYRYHHLFADVLRQRLTRSASNTILAGLHERASLWYEQQGLIAEAIQHALLITDGMRAARLIEQHGLNTLLSGQVQTVLGWLSRFPADLRQARPFLGIIHALALVFTGDLDGAEARLLEVERCIGPDTSPADTRLMQGNVAAIRANIALYAGDLASCAAYGKQVLDLLPETEVIARTMARLHLARAFRATGDVTFASEQNALAALGPIRDSGNLLGVLGAVINLARMQELQGRLRSAAATYGELIPIAKGLDGLRGLHAALQYYVGLGNLYYEWNQLDSADEYLTQTKALQPGVGTVDAEYVMFGYLGLARLQQARGEYAHAQETLATFTDLARQRGFAPHLLTRTAAVQAQLALATGKLPAAIAWAEASGLGTDDTLAFSREAEYLILARVWVAQAGAGDGGGFLAQALYLLDRLLTDASAKDRQASVLEILIVRALALAAQGQTPEALITLGRALTLGAPEGYIRSFIDEGPVMWALLKSIDAGVVASAPGYVPQLLAAIAIESGATTRGHGHFATATTSQLSNSELAESLTARELDVLRLIAAGHTNAEVAKVLVIALSTVKTHTNTIFGKLGVKNRTQAIARARDLQLL